MLQSHFFNPNRTQPFLVTFFQAVLAFRRLFKKMKMRLGHSGHQTANKKSALHTELRKSQRTVQMVTKGRSVVDLDDFLPPDDGSRVERVEKEPISMVQLPGAKLEELFRSVTRQINQFHLQLSHNRVAELEGKLDQMAAIDDGAHKKRSKQNTNKSHGDKKSSGKNSYFQSFGSTIVADDHDENKQVAEVGEYLEGTSIYFGATIALQARHGGFLSYNASEVKASAHKVMGHSRFVVKKSDDLTDIGTVNYGDALWLQSGPTTVLGAQYGSLVDQKREIQPSLISCKRQHMFKAQQYGRWIILNRDNPMGKLGQPVGHFDRIILEQEWYFLASTSPYESSMYKSLNNSDEAMTTKIDLFRPSEECTWKVHLVALPIEDSGNEQQRQQLLQDAKDQIDHSQQARYEKSPFLLTSLADKLPARLGSDVLMNTKLKHKASAKSEQEYLYQLYKKLESEGFQSKSGSVAFLSKTYGPQSPIVLFKSNGLSPTKFREGSTFISTTKSNPVEGPSQLDKLEDKYWAVAHRLLINTKSWGELPQIMEEFEQRDIVRKLQATIVLQKWIRKHLEKRFNYERAMRKVDRRARTKLEEKTMQRRKLLMEHTATAELIQKELQVHAKSEVQPTKTIHKAPKPIVVRKEVEPVLPEFDESVVIAMAKDMVAHSASTPFLTEVNAGKMPKAYSTSHIVTINKVLSFPVRPSSGYGTRPETTTTFENKRPMSASAKPRDHKSENQQEDRVRPDKTILINTMMQQQEKDYGLPADVLDDIQSDVNAKVGLRFLKAMSSNPEIYKNIKLKRRKKSNR